LEYMKTVPDKFFELAIVDPPYGVGDFRVGCGVAKKGTEIYKEIKWNSSIPKEEYFNELYRISKDTIVFGFQYYMKYVRGTGIIIHNKKVPYKINLSMADCAITTLQKRVTVFDYRWHGFLQEDMKNKECRIHPCQKPVALYRWLLQNYAKPGYKIFDSHVGSGSSLVACVGEGFEYVGCELDEDYYRAASERIEKVKSQGKLFNT